VRTKAKLYLVLRAAVRAKQKMVTDKKGALLLFTFRLSNFFAVITFFKADFFSGFAKRMRIVRTKAKLYLVLRAAVRAKQKNMVTDKKGALLLFTFRLSNFFCGHRLFQSRYSFS